MSFVILGRLAGLGKKISHLQPLRPICITVTVAHQIRSPRVIVKPALTFGKVIREIHQESGRMNDTCKISAVLIDLSGTLHIEDEAIPGSQKALERLRESDIAVKFVTNATKEPLRLVLERLTMLGFKLKKDEIFTSLTAARKVVEKKGVRPLLYLEDVAKEDFEGIPEEDPNAVVVGLAPSCFDYQPMNKAFRLLLDGAELIAIHKARYFKKKDGLYLGPGGFVSALEYACGIQATVVGKPEADFFNEAISDLNTTHNETVMIGDDVRDDVKGAMDAGLKAILVRTGKYRVGDETKILPEPTATCNDFPAAVEYILKNNKVS